MRSGGKSLVWMDLTFSVIERFQNLDIWTTKNEPGNRKLQYLYEQRGFKFYTVTVLMSWENGPTYFFLEWGFYPVHFEDRRSDLNPLFCLKWMRGRSLCFLAFFFYGVYTRMCRESLDDPILQIKVSAYTCENK